MITRINAELFYSVFGEDAKVQLTKRGNGDHKVETVEISDVKIYIWSNMGDAKEKIESFKPVTELQRRFKDFCYKTLYSCDI